MMDIKDKIKVLIVDDSALIRQLLTKILCSDPQISVVGTAGDPHEARTKIKQLNPDVLTLDVEMPKMDGLTFLKKLMKLRPMPVIMISTLTEKGAEITLEALENGAIDYIPKPKLDVSHELQKYTEDIVEKIKFAANTDPASKGVLASRHCVLPGGKPSPTDTNNTPIKHQLKTTDKIVALGASTGGTEAIDRVLSCLPADAPGMVISQHIPKAFSGPFASRMNNSSEMTVCEATNGQQILQGHVYIAPGDQHLRVEKSGARYICKLDDGPPVNRHKPSVDVMFDSVAKNVGENAIGVILTGMGGDGAKGMKLMLDSGATTVAQDEKSSVVWGMPGEAVKAGGVRQVLSLDKIATEILVLAKP